MDVPLPPDGKVTEAGLKDRLGPDGDVVPVSVRVPLNPLRLVMVIVVVAADP